MFLKKITIREVGQRFFGQISEAERFKTERGNFQLFNFRKQSKGFSIAEIAVVVALMLVLGGIVINTSSKTRDRASYATAESALDAITTAVTTSYATLGEFGTITAGDLQSAFDTDMASEIENNMATKLDNLTDPWNEPYQIKGTNLTDIDSGTGTGVELHVYVKDSAGTGTRSNPYKKTAAGVDGVDMDRLIFQK